MRRLALVISFPALSFSALHAAGAPVILISIDTLRADHLSAYGYHKLATPDSTHAYSRYKTRVPGRFVKKAFTLWISAAYSSFKCSCRRAVFSMAATRRASMIALTEDDAARQSTRQLRQ